ncbi:hypothetical protein [Streptomyces vinaceus]|uniref:hypothetical protein n=1 Tax=Streptomyces vinaceus TaxID=1960 RepID=UPI00123DBAD0|nr:hypothetical protein [Streptomyces vinaceus]
MSARTAVQPQEVRQGAPADAEVTVRTGFRFSADGLRAACTATGTDGRHFAEGWSLHPSGPRLDLRTDLGGDPPGPSSSPSTARACWPPGTGGAARSRWPG